MNNELDLYIVLNTSCPLLNQLSAKATTHVWDQTGPSYNK